LRAVGFTRLRAVGFTRLRAVLERAAALILLLFFLGEAFARDAVRFDFARALRALLAGRLAAFPAETLAAPFFGALLSGACAGAGSATLSVRLPK
jgi:hypothetical protein